MRFNVSQLLKQPTGATKHYDIDEPSEIQDPDLELVGPITGHVDLLRTHRGILASAKLNQTVKAQCVRCLADMQIPLRIECEEEYLPVIDLKTGGANPVHRDDLRFYALVETLRSGVPPRKVASFYLDAGEPVVEDVTERSLMTASRRMLDGVHAEIELQVEGREPVKRPGTSCRWCPLAPECAEGQAYLAGPIRKEYRPRSSSSSARSSNAACDAARSSAV